MKFFEETIAGLKTFLVQGEPTAPTVIMLHGYGANGRDLISLSREIKTQQKLNWIFPEGFISLEQETVVPSKAWFSIDWLMLDSLLKSGKVEDYTILEPPGLQEAKEKVLNLLKSLNLSLENIIIGGFSQGAMLSTEIALNSDIAPKGLLILSGTLICREKWTLLAQKNKGFSFFQSHGKNDMVLPYQKATQLYEILTNTHLNGNFHEFEGGHEIPFSIIQKLTSYLDKS